MSVKMGRSRAGGRVLSTVGRIFLIIAIIVLSIICVFAYKSLKIKTLESERKSQKIEQLNDSLEAANDKTDELSKAKNQSVSDEEYESLAREEGLIKKDEIVIKPR